MLQTNFVLLLRDELRAKFSPAGLLLTAAVGASARLVASSYHVRELAANLDFINLMTYDFHGSWEQRTGQNAPLYASNVDSDRSLNVDAAVSLWLQQGAPAHKLVLGIGLYGRSFTLSSANSALGAPSSNPGTAGPYTREPGMLGYNEICEMQRTQPGWNVRWDPQQRVPYAFRGNQWVGYDNIDSVRTKAEYARSKGLGGAMVWSVETDDFRGKCGAGVFPLITTIKNTIG